MAPALTAVHSRLATLADRLSGCMRRVDEQRTAAYATALERSQASVRDLRAGNAALTRAMQALRERAEVTAAEKERCAAAAVHRLLQLQLNRRRRGEDPLAGYSTLPDDAPPAQAAAGGAAGPAKDPWV